MEDGTPEPPGLMLCLRGFWLMLCINVHNNMLPDA